MRYLMRQKLFSLGEDFFIKDESGTDVFVVDGKAFSFGDQLSFQDLAGNELCAVVEKEPFTFFNCRFTVDLPGPDDLEAKGDFLDHEYEFHRGGERVATVSKRWFTWADIYGVEIGEGVDDVLILASTVVIDLACHTEEE